MSAPAAPLGGSEPHVPDLHGWNARIDLLSPAPDSTLEVHEAVVAVCPELPDGTRTPRAGAAEHDGVLGGVDLGATLEDLVQGNEARAELAEIRDVPLELLAHV